MKQLAARLLWIPTIFLLGAIAPLAAQTTGSVRGEVETGGTPLPGVSVEARSPNLQGVRTSVTDENGRFNLTLLPPGSYTLTATLPGFAPKSQTLQLALNQAAVLRFELIAAAAAEVTVTAAAATVETESNAVGRTMSAATFEALPTGRNYASVAQLAGGINTDNSDVRQTSITVYGSTGLENAYLVDGANTTGVEIGNQGKVLNFEFIQEVEMKFGGYEAEYTGAQGGILNVVTKSGGNEYHGDVFGYFDNDSLQAENKHLDEIAAEGIPAGFTRSDYGVDIGGYVLKDRLWFFGAYDHVKNTDQRQITTGPETGTITDLDSTSNLYSGKLTWTVTPSNTLIGTVFGDPTDDVGAVAPVIGPPMTYNGTVTVGGTDFGFRYQGTLSSNWLVTGQFAYHREDVDTLPGPGGDQIVYVDNRTGTQVASGGFLGPGGEGQFALKKYTRYDYLADVNYFLGSHDLKAGFGFQRIDADVFRNTSGGQIVEILDPLEDDPLGRTVFSHTFFASLDSTIQNPSVAPVIATPQNDIFAVFIQDRWQILGNLTLNAGVRWEKQLIRGLDNLTYIDIDHFSPRVGFTWDFMNNGRTKAYASYSQFVPFIPMDMNVRSLNGERDGFTTNFDPVALACDEEFFGEDDCAIRGTAVDDIDPNLHSPYSEEILAGVEWQFTDTWVVGVRGIYRSLSRVLEDTYIPELDNYAFFNPGDSVLAPEFAPGKRYFRGIELTAQKRLSDCWMLFASYLYSSLRGNFDGSFRAIGGFFARNPFITDDFDYPEFQVNAYGDLTLDRPHQAKLQVAYVFPFGLTTSASGYYQSGLPLSRIGWWDAYIGPELFITPRGSEGRSPDTYEIDLQADYGLRLGPVTVHILASLFNVLNRQQITQVDQVWAIQEADNELPEPTNPTYGLGNQWQQPRTLRLGARVSF
jgi:Carboxypeptidase regulatory-like domain/TonB dependent receptor-like, beta-barrel